MVKDHNRQYGFARRDGAYSEIGPLVATDMQRRPAYLLVKEYYWDKDGLVTPSEEHFMPKEGVFARVIVGGVVRAGDPITVIA